MNSNSYINSIVDNAKRVITDPAGFYRDMPKSGGLGDPVIFLLVMAAIVGLIVALWSFFGGGFAAGAGAIVMVPIMALIGSFIGAAIAFVIWKLMGSNESYETAYRCVAYASAVYPISAVLSLMPYIGSIVAVAWGFYLMIIASEEVHSIARKTAFIVFGILGAAVILLNIGSEMAARRMTASFEGLGEKMQQIQKDGEVSPHEAGKAFGEFLKGLEEATQKKE